MAVFLRGSSYYLKIRVRGRQVLRSLNTLDARDERNKARLLLATLEGPIDTASDTTLPGTFGELFAIFQDLRYSPFVGQVW